jgi:Tol biopolymer transport system component
VGAYGRVALLAIVTMLLTGALVLAQPGGGQPPLVSIPVTGPVAGVPGRLLFVAHSPQGRSVLRTFEIATGTIKDLVVHPEGQYAATPAAAPDGRTVAYSLYRPAPQGLAQVGGVDLESVNADGTNRRTLLAHHASGVSLSEPAWAKDGRSIYYTRTLPDGSRSIDRVDAAGRTRTIIPDATGPTVSGTRAAFLRTNPQTFAQSLWIARVNGQDARTLVSDSVFLQLGTPRFSPDGSHIAFAAAGGPPRPLPKRTERGPTPPNRWWAPRTAWAHGPPMDLWLVDARGIGLRALTALGEDDTIPAWSSNGRWIAFTGVAGLYLVEVSTRQVRLIVEDGSGGGLTWLSR